MADRTHLLIATVKTMLYRIPFKAVSVGSQWKQYAVSIDHLTTSPVIELVEIPYLKMVVCVTEKALFALASNDLSCVLFQSEGKHIEVQTNSFAMKGSDQ